jgi:hypothetical protein
MHAGGRCAGHWRFCLIRLKRRRFVEYAWKSSSGDVTAGRLMVVWMPALLLGKPPQLVCQNKSFKASCTERGPPI